MLVIQDDGNIKTIDFESMSFTEMHSFVFHAITYFCLDRVMFYIGRICRKLLRELYFKTAIKLADVI